MKTWEVGLKLGFCEWSHKEELLEIFRKQIVRERLGWVKMVSDWDVQFLSFNMWRS